jgi:lysozyme
MNSYTIQYGDTLSGIASKTGKSIQELMRLNPSITDPNKIYAGRTLSLGASAAPAPAPTPAPPKANDRSSGKSHGPKLCRRSYFNPDRK